MQHQSGQIDRNYEAFREFLPSLLQSHPGQFVLLHDEDVIDFFDTSLAAVTEGLRRFGAGEYSVQEVSGQAENLGFYSYAGGTLQA